MIRLAAVLSCALLACTDHSAADAQKEAGAFATIVEAPIYAPFERLGPEPYTSTLQDRRSLFADRIEDQNLPMLRRLKKGEMGNFGGIEWRWRDGPEKDGLGSLTGVAYFLRAPDASLRRYTQDRSFVAAQGSGCDARQRPGAGRGWPIGDIERFYGVTIPAACPKGDVMRLHHMEPIPE